MNDALQPNARPASDAAPAVRPPPTPHPVHAPTDRSPPRDDPPMPGFLTRIADGWDRALDSLALALVPVLFAALDANKVASVLAFDGVHVGFKVGAPVSVVTVWQFVSVPNSGVAVDAGVPVESLPLAPVTVPALLVVQAGLSAGYFGSIEAELADGTYDFVGNVAAYVVPFLVLTVVPFLLFLPLALGLFGLGAAGGLPAGVFLLIVALLVFVVAAYLFYATPYLVVLRDAGVVEAARGSYGLAVEGGAYLAYFLGFALFVLVVSPVASVLVVDVPVVGLPVGIVAGGVLGLAANVATMRFVADVDPESPDFGSWEGDDGSDAPTAAEGEEGEEKGINATGSSHEGDGDGPAEHDSDGAADHATAPDADDAGNDDADDARGP